VNIDLSGKTILVGVSGSIAAYKACELARLFVKSGADVHVVMSDNAIRFVSPLTFEALTSNPVLHSGTESWSCDLNHINIGKKADAFVIAPATANTINKLSKGLADTLLLQTALAYKGPLLIAPAANTNMIENHYTQGSLKMLAVNDVTIISPQNKLLACGDTGNGALSDPLEIFYQTVKAIMIDDFWLNRKVVITGGGTREKIDEVRYIGNFSSGKMGNALATALYIKGADVCYITTMPHGNLPKDIYTIDVQESTEMLEYTVDAVRVAKKGKMSKATLNNPEAIGMISKTPYLFMVAAVADYKPKFPQKGKLKKNQLGDSWSIELTQTEDILGTIDKSGIITIGFKAEMDHENGLENAKDSLKSKDLDAVCFNQLSNSDSFGTEENKISLITDKEEHDLGLHDKFTLSMKIVQSSKDLLKRVNE